MFGNAIDYYVLRPFTHDRRMRTGHDSAFVDPTYSPDDARNYLTKAKTLYFDNALPVDPKMSYLDVGCGSGQLSVALSLAGVNHVTGVDVSAQVSGKLGQSRASYRSRTDQSSSTQTSTM